MLENARKGLPVDIRKIPPPPDYDEPVLVEMSGPRPPLARQDSSSARLLHDFADQLKKARSLTNQFTQLGSLDKGKISLKFQNFENQDRISKFKIRIKFQNSEI